jgi:hypothetical protein
MQDGRSSGIPKIHSPPNTKINRKGPESVENRLLLFRVYLHSPNEPKIDSEASETP